MLYPQQNPFRQVHDLSGFWDIKFDLDDRGHALNWEGGFKGGEAIAVPGSWNDQFAHHRDIFGPAWYQTRFSVPWGWQNTRIMLRFGSVNYLAEVYLNGTLLGEHEGGHLPFEFDITSKVQSGENLLVVRVDGRLTPYTVPPGNVTPTTQDTFIDQTKDYPSASFDFFPFAGIHRPVLLYTAPHSGIADLTVTTFVERTTGLVRVKINHQGELTRAKVTLERDGLEYIEETSPNGANADLMVRVPSAALWEPGSPALYNLRVELFSGQRALDQYTLPVGIRTVRVEGDRLLLNEKPIYLTGFGRHEDFPITGRGYLPPVIIKDYALMRWMGANSFRTSHYPYSEQMMQLADRQGFLIIDETPAVGLYFADDGLEQRLELCRQFQRELIDRDKNHPSVIMWSLANEPHSNRPASREFFQNLSKYARSLDDTRPITVVSYVGIKEEAFDFCDVVCLNRYNGWYTQAGQIEQGVSLLSEELDAIHERYPKPMIMTEFGADTLPGWHAQPAEMFSEEYQVEFLTRYIELFAKKPYIIGEHVWNMCDFKTGQSVRRVGALNYKGVFTRDRRPKMAAHKLRDLWLRRTDTFLTPSLAVHHTDEDTYQRIQQP